MADITEQQFLAQDPEVLNYQRQRQLANLLVGGAFDQPQGQMISGHFVKPSGISQALPTIKAAIGALTNANLDTKQNELADMLRGKQSEAMQQYIRASQGTPVQMYPAQAGPMPSGGNIPQQIQTPATGPNYGEMLKAASGRYASPMLQAAGAELLKPIKTAEGETVSRLNLGPGGGLTTMAQGPEKKTELIRDYNQAVSSGAFKGSIVDYDLMRRNASANRQSVNVQNQLPFKEQIQKEAASGLMKNFETLQNVPSALANMDKMVALSKQPIYAGVGGETKLQIAKLFNNNFGTNISPETVKNTEEFKSAAYMGIMDNLKKTDSNPTMAQQNALKEAIGSLGTDPAAIPRVVNVMRDVLVNKATQHNELVRQTMQRGVEYPYSIEVQLPKATPATSGNVRSLADEILFRKPGAPQ